MRTALCALLLGLLLAGCGVAAQPLVFGPAPWQDGETSEYDVLDANGAQIGSAVWLWKAVPEGWRQSWTVELPGRIDRGSVLLGQDLFPLRSELAVGERAVYRAVYGSDQIELLAEPAQGEAKRQSAHRPQHPLDNGQVLQTQRALPLTQGYATRYTNVIPTTQALAPMLVQVVGTETVATPAGSFQAWRLVMTAGGRSHDAWYAVEPPHLLVKYHNRAAGSQFVLRRYRPFAGAPWKAAATPAAPSGSTVPSSAGPDWLRVGLAFGLQYPLMILLPLLLGWWIRRRYGISWRVYAIGGATFLLSQVVHLPLNYALGLLGPGGRGVALWPLPWVALVAGLSSGVCEEVARWLVLRTWLRDTRGWAGALQFGAGHGGCEAILFGFLGALGMLSALAASLAGHNAPELAAYWQTPWYEFVLAGLERVFAITAHIGMAMLVMRAVQARRPLWLMAAIGVHSAMNFWAVWGLERFGVVAVEAGLAVIALAMLALIVTWRKKGALAARQGG